jgi:hypothetical protein
MVGRVYHGVASSNSPLGRYFRKPVARGGAVLVAEPADDKALQVANPARTGVSNPAMSLRPAVSIAAVAFISYVRGAAA